MENKFILLTGFESKRKFGIKTDNIVNFYTNTVDNCTNVSVQEINKLSSTTPSLHYYQVLETPEEIYNMINQKMRKILK
jgi:hypothetical protein